MTHMDGHDGVHLTPAVPTVLIESSDELFLYSIDPNPFPRDATPIQPLTVDLPLTSGWAALFANAGLDAHRRLAADRRRYMSGPDRWERKIARVYRIPPRLLGLTPPPLAIDGPAYRRRQKNRVKRGRRR